MQRRCTTFANEYFKRYRFQMVRINKRVPFTLSNTQLQILQCEQAFKEYIWRYMLDTSKMAGVALKSSSEEFIADHVSAELDPGFLTQKNRRGHQYSQNKGNNIFVKGLMFQTKRMFQWGSVSVERQNVDRKTDTTWNTTFHSNILGVCAIA